MAKGKSRGTGTMNGAIGASPVKDQKGISISELAAENIKKNVG